MVHNRTLQLEILERFALNGELSKAKVMAILKREDYGNISVAIDNLKEHTEIEPASIKPGRGRPEVFYKINERGMNTLISNHPAPDKFWKLTIGFCIHSHEEVSSQKVERFFDLFLQNFLRYSSRNSFVFPLELFSEMQNSWLKEKILVDGSINLEQQVLEILANNRAITLKQLVNSTAGADETATKESLSIYVPIQHRPLIIDKDFSVGKATEKMYKKTEWEFLLHNVVRVKHNLKGNETFELSLFGVLLVLTLIRYNDIGKLKHGLFYNSVSLSTYYDKIADNYRDKLPLVFGKWYLLKRILKIFSAYNFDILLDRETLSKAIGESIHNGGIKEFYVGMTSLAENNRHQMHKVQFSGLGALLNDTRYTNTRRVESDSHYQERVNLQYVNFRPIVQKLIEITVLLNPFDYDPDSFVEMLKSSNLFSEIKNPEYVSNLYDTQIIEEAFADEVSFLYYLSLQSSSFAISHPVNDYLVAQNENEAYFYTLNTQPEREILPPRFNNEDVYSFNRSFYPLLPKERLVSILQKDKEIKIWFSKWMQDLISCQEEVFKFMYVRFKELNIKSD